MANTKNFWTALKSDSRWHVTQEGTGKDCGSWSAQAPAWEECKRLARISKGEAFLKGRDGTIRERETYGNDPIRSPG